jgi:hypothetical protein
MTEQRDDNIALLTDMQKTIVPHAEFELIKEARRLRSVLENVDSKSISNVRRADDAGHDIYTVFNRIQESLVRGGNLNRKSWRRVSAVKSPDQIARLNRGLFVKAKELFLEAA